jgi:dolichol-phosphate mannosyltransferase
MILGIIGVYIAKIFYQSKHRPHYIIKETNL